MVLDFLALFWINFKMRNCNIKLNDQTAPLIENAKSLDGIFKKPGAVALPDSPGEAVSRFRGDIEETMWFV